MAKVYPTAAIENDAFYLALDGGTDQEVGITAPTRGVKGDSAEIEWMKSFEQIRKRLQGGTEGQVVKVTTTSIGVFPLEYTLAGVAKTYDGTLGVNVTTADATYYWYLDQSNTLVESTTLPAAPHVMLASVVITGGVIASIVDLRNQNTFNVIEDSGRVVAVTTTSIGVLPLEYRLGGTAKTYAGVASQAVTTTDATYYWYLDESNVLIESTVVPTTPHVMLAKVVIAGSVISSITDLRTRSMFDVQVGSVGGVEQVTSTTISVSALEYALGGENKTYPGIASQTVTTTDATYYWYLDESNALIESTAVPTMPHVMLAKVVIAGSVISSITDLRTQTSFDVPIDGGRLIQVSSNQIGVFPLDYVLGGVRKNYPGIAAVNITIVSGTAYWYLDANNALLEDVNPPTGPHIMLAKVTYASSVITSITDLRSEARMDIGLDGGRVVQIGLVAFGVYPLEFKLAGVQKSYAGSAVNNHTTTDGTYYWYLDKNTNLIGGPTIPTAPHVMLAEIIITAGIISSIKDLRDQSRVDVVTSGQVAGMLPTIDYVIGAESVDDIQITIQVKDADGNNLASEFLIDVWMADTVAGAETATALDLFTLTTGVLLETITAAKHWRIITNTIGKAIFTANKTGAQTYYARGEVNGKVITSTAISFT